jgi:hypothetical protein
MGTAGSSRTSVTIYKITQPYSPENSHLKTWFTLFTWYWKGSNHELVHKNYNVRSILTKKRKGLKKSNIQHHTMMYISMQLLCTINNCVLKDTKTSSMLGIISETSRAMLTGVSKIWPLERRWNCCRQGSWYCDTLETSLCVYTFLSLSAPELAISTFIYIYGAREEKHLSVK